MTCGECGGKLTTRRENVKYDAVGLPGVTLRNLEVRRCKACGEVEYVIPDLAGLHRAIATVVVAHAAPLTPAEIKFLRKHLGWSGGDFAAHMGATPETVSRWEHGKLPMSAQADRLLRALVVVTQPVTSYPLDTLKAITPKTTGTPLRVGLRRRPSGWKADAA